MKPFLLILFLCLGVLFQTTLIPFLDFKGVAPNLVLVLVLLLVIFKEFKNVWWAILAGGFFCDLWAGLPFGLISLSLVLTAYCLDWFKRSIFSEIKFWITGALVVLGSLAYNLLLFALARIFGVNLDFGFSYLIIETLYNLLMALIFYAFIKKIFYQS